jgi:hypothetical protein
MACKFKWFKAGDHPIDIFAAAAIMAGNTGRAWR